MPELSASPAELVKTAWAFLEESDLVASAAEVQAATDRLAKDIEKKLADAYPLVLAVMGGAVVFAGQVLPKLRFPLDFDYIHASRYGAATRGANVEWRVSPPQAVRGRAVLVLDDILDGGDTMAAIRDRLMTLGAASFHCAVLVEKMLEREKPIAADFVGLRIQDRFVFGCGMDAKGYWRNLPEIRAMKESGR
jgi:hypoxanthine phosphoribosyltransferase